MAVIIDLFSRKVVGWAVDDHMRTELALRALDQATQLRSPDPGLIHHTDRGVQYASIAYQERLTAMGVRQSMSRKGDCWDNAVAESFFGTLKQELVRRWSWHDADHARLAVSDYIHRFFNTERRHSSLGQRSPVAFEADSAHVEAQAA